MIIKPYPILSNHLFFSVSPLVVQLSEDPLWIVVIQERIHSLPLPYQMAHKHLQPSVCQMCSSQPSLSVHLVWVLALLSSNQLFCMFRWQWCLSWALQPLLLYKYFVSVILKGRNMGHVIYIFWFNNIMYYKTSCSVLVSNGVAVDALNPLWWYLFKFFEDLQL